MNAYWEWDSGGGTFLPYAVIASIDIEMAYQRRSPSLDLSTSTSKLLNFFTTLFAGFIKELRFAIQ